MHPVILLPGFTASDLVILSSQELLWWDTNISPLLSLGGMRLAPNGIDPGPPDGVRLALLSSPLQFPWDPIQSLLQLQLGTDSYRVQVLPYDWRLDLLTIATNLAQQLRISVAPGQPATLVGHSAGGLVAVLAYGQLVASGDAAKVRRVVTIGTPFQGSYSPLLWLVGFNPTVQQLLAVSQGFGRVTGFDPANWTLGFLNGLALSWPSFYELYPFLGGSEASIDPNRPLLYNAANYRGIATPSQAWLDYSRNTFQPAVTAAAATLPYWVLTTVAAQGLATPQLLDSNLFPLELTHLGYTQDGDALVTAGSATVSRGLNYYIGGDHASLPLGITVNGMLKDLILDPRGPVTPPLPPVYTKLAVPANASYPPEAEFLSGLSCLSGG